jgi:hypothetical protein
VQCLDLRPRGALVAAEEDAPVPTSAYPAWWLRHETAVLPTFSRSFFSYDNALAESVPALYKTELIRRQGPWRSLEQVELATACWVDWF